MALRSPRFANNPRLQKAADNAPPLRQGETGEAVWLVQRALLDLGYLMPISTKKQDGPDGIFGDETFRTVARFQTDQGIGRDGVAGRDTMAKLDALFPNNTPPPVPKRGTDPARELPYRIPGLFDLIKQPTNLVCWATAATMMLEWKRQVCMDIGKAMDVADAQRPATVAARISYRQLFNANKGLPPSEFVDFLNCIGVSRAPMACYPLATWLRMLKRHGPLWVGTLFGDTAGSGLHSRIIVGIHGDGSVEGTWMDIADPWDGLEHAERFDKFTYKYEQAFVDSNYSPSYFQVRHF
jgi:peptidoglycan hydrolase-like protein with peptidoglycan-binding domain